MKLSTITFSIVVTLTIAGCSRSDIPVRLSAAAPASVPDVMILYGCPTCHVIPNVPGAVGKVGPSLDDLAQRSFLAGTLQNSPENLVHWIQHPQQVHPGTAMPEMGVTSSDAKRIAAFLETQQ